MDREGGNGVVRLTGTVATDGLRQMTEKPCGHYNDATKAAIMARSLSRHRALLDKPLDGAWWRKHHDPDHLAEYVHYDVIAPSLNSS